MKSPLIAFLLAASSMAGAHAAERVISMDLVDAAGKQAWVGEVTVSETPYGLLFTPQLRALPPGLHGFHLHENPSCGPKEKDGKAVAALGIEVDRGHARRQQGAARRIAEGELYLCVIQDEADRLARAALRARMDLAPSANLPPPLEVAGRDHDEEREDDLVDDPRVGVHPFARLRQECLTALAQRHQQERRRRQEEEQPEQTRCEACLRH